MDETQKNIAKKRGDRLQNCRIAAGYRKKIDLVRAVHEEQGAGFGERGLNSSTLSDYERGVKPLSEKYATVFAKLLHVRPEYLLCIDDYKTGKDMLLGTYIGSIQRESGIIAILESHGYRLNRIRDTASNELITESITPIQGKWMNQRYAFSFSRISDSTPHEINGRDWLIFQSAVMQGIPLLFERFLDSPPPAATN